MTEIEDRILRLVRNEPGISGGAVAVRLGGVPTDYVSQWETFYSLEERSLLRHEWRMQEGAWTRCWFPGPVCR